MLRPTTFLIFLLSIQTTAATGAQTGCRISADKIHELTDSQLRAFCKKTGDSLPAVESFPGTFHSLKQCRRVLGMARENGRVIYATSQRQIGFKSAMQEISSQREAFESGARNLLKLHNFTNVSLAATYRSRLKLRHFSGIAEKSLQAISEDLLRAKRQVEDERRAFPETVPNPAVPRFEMRVEKIQAVHAELLSARDCLEQMKEPLNESFDSWAKVKAELLRNPFEKLVLNSDDIGEKESPDLVEARRLQKEQQYVYDMLTDPAKRDWAYRLAEGCLEHRCQDWSPYFSVAGWTAQFAGLISSTPVLGATSKVIAAGLAGDLAMRQGLTFWQQVREAGNALIPFGFDPFATEIKDIEKGKVKSWR